MKSPLRGLAASLLALATVLPQSARADDANSCKLNGLGQLRVMMEGPRASIPVKINGRETRLWLDSGAFFNFMSNAQAAEFSLRTEALPTGFYVTGIGGSFTPTLATVRDFELAGATLHGMQFVVGGTDVGNGFLGANLLGVFDTEFDLSKGVIRLFHAKSCHNVNLAYWGSGMVVGQIRKTTPGNENDHHIYGEISINGHKLTAMFDTGAPTTLLSLQAAKRAGIDMDAPKVTASMQMGGVGAHMRRSWIVRTDTIDLGGEVIEHSPIRVVDDDFGSSHQDLIVGMDFFLSHHVLVSPSTGTIFLTYNGGPIFSVSTDAEIGHLETRSESMGKSEAEAEPKTADEWAGRGSARLEKGDYPGAIADLGAAIKLAPTRANLLADRASAYARNGQPDLAAKDIDAALVIAPNDPDLLFRRANIRLGKADKTGALADVDAAVAASPKGSLLLMRAVMLYERLGKPDKGLGVIDAVIALHHDDSQYPMLLNARAWNRALANTDLDRALADVNTALRKQKGEGAFFDTRALVQLRRKDFAAAIADASAVLAAAPKASSSLFFRGLAQIAAGQAAAGDADIAAARALSPKIDQRFAAYGLVAPNPPKPPSTPAQSSASDGDDESDQ